MEQQNNHALTLGSLFDGSGGFPLGGILSRITPLWASEIVPFAVRVTTKQLLQMKHYGDVSKLSGRSCCPWICKIPGMARVIGMMNGVVNTLLSVLSRTKVA